MLKRKLLGKEPLHRKLTKLSMESVTNLIKITSNNQIKMSPEADFFRAWAEFTKPIHKLAKREMDVFAAFLKKRWELDKGISNKKLLDSYLMSVEIKGEIRKECGVTPKHFQMIMGKFRKNGVITKEGRIALNLIPVMSEGGVGLMVWFDFTDGQHIKLDTCPSIPKA